MAANSYCPEPIRLQALLAGRLDDQDPEHAELVRHLDGCESCQTALTRLAEGGESLVGKARQLAEENPHERTVLRDLVARFRSKLDETTTPIDDALRLDFLGPASRPGLLGTLAHYEVIEVLGQGGMGIVFKALDPGLNRYVAVKVMAPQLAVVAAARKRFAREARAAAALSHEHVVAIYAVDEYRGLPYLVMPLVVGESLQSRLDRLGPLDLTQILRIGMQIASGLAAAHAQGLIHRDIKPANILLENGVERVKITDFGLARTVDDASLTESGILVGSPQYMAPEQARGEPLDHRADLFSLGGVMYAMCLGRSPFRAPTALAVLKRVCEDAPRPLREVNPEVPDWLAAIIDKLLEKTPEARYQTAAEVASILEKRLAEHQLPTKTPAAAIAEPPPAPPRRRNRWATAAMIALAVLAALGWTEATAVTHVGEMIATILRIKTPEGTLIIQVDDPTADVRVEADGKEIVITGAGVHEVRLRPGRHQLKVTKDGKPVREELITITRGGKQVAKIERELIAKVAPPLDPSDRQTQSQKPGSDSPPLDPSDRQTQSQKPGSDSPPLDPSDRQTPRSGLVDADQAAKAASPIQRLEPTRQAVPDSTSPGSMSQMMMMGRGNGNAQPVPDHSIPIQVTILPGRNTAFPKPSVPRPLFTLDAGTGLRTTAVAYALNGKILALASLAVIQIWDVNTRTRLATVNNDPATKHWANTVISLDFSGDGKYLAAGSFNGSVTIYGMSSPQAFKRIHRMTGHVGKDTSWPDCGVWKVAFLPDHPSVLASASWDNTVRFWDVKTGAQIGENAEHPGKVRTLAFSPDGKTFATGMGFEPGNNVMIRDRVPLRTPVIATLPGNTNGTVCMAYSPDGTILATGGQDNLVRLWDVEHRTELARLSGHGQLVEAVAFSPDGKWLISVSGNYRMPEESGEIRIWDIDGTRTQSVQNLLPATGAISGLSFAPDGKTFATSCGDGTVRVWNFEPKVPSQSEKAQILWPRIAIQPKSGDAVTSLAASPDAKWLAAGTRGAVHLYLPALGDIDPALVQVSKTQNPLQDPHAFGSAIMKLAISPDGKLLASSSANGVNTIWGTRTGKEIAHRERPYVTTFPIAFQRENQLLVTYRDNVIQAWDFLTGETKQFANQYRAGGLEVSPDGKLLAIFGEADPSGVIRLVNGETGTKLGGLFPAGAGIQAEVICLRFTSDSKRMVVASRKRSKDAGDSQAGLDMAREVFEINSLNVSNLAVIPAPDTINWNHPILDIAISPDGNHLAVVGGKPGERDSDKNKAVLLSNWDSSRPGAEKTVRFLDGHGDIVRAVAFFDGGKQVATACDDGFIRFWKVPMAK